MRNVLILLPSFEPSGATRQALLLARGLPRDRAALRIVALRGTDRFAGPFRNAGIPVDCLNLRSGLDLAGWYRLQQLVADTRPDVLHAWRWPAVLAATALIRRPFLRADALPALVASEPLRDCPNGPMIRWLAQRLLATFLSGKRRIAVSSAAEAATLRSIGLPDPCLTMVPPAIEPITSRSDRAATLARLGVPPDAKVIVAAGRFDAERDLRSAVWSFDILRYRFPDARLVLCGDGPERPRIESFILSTMGRTPLIHLVGWQENMPTILQAADVVWVTNTGDGGRGVALEAMAAGRPLVLTNRPNLTELLAGDDSIPRIEPADRVALARQTHRLFSEPATAARIGLTVRHLVGVRYPPSRLVEAYARIYGEGP